MNKKTEQAFEEIAQKTLLMETLKTRNTSRDFEEVAVWQVKKALEQAYQLGLKHGQKQ
ncbi:hypothetical protein [Endozoicomonas sp. 4G]|uniref:DUF6900 domain-containing protein n=1 Tax=Endozoicomonas sp. 4G TaxID=2872754 RepID=UPI0020786801|nr:hypothetical protein [Endozoicomonas sp. 4G]